MAMSKLDANQVIKSVYSEADGALKTVPAASTSFSIELDATDGDSVETRSMAVDVVTLSSAVSAAASFNTVSVNCLQYNTLGVQFSWTGLNAADATLQLQGSYDGTVWFNEGAVETLAASPGNAKRKVTDNDYKQFRVVYAHGTVSAGSITLKYVMKG